mgnify:FL=1|jgi:hypothetical protein|tara:strand:- start:2 stop:223 length:222 start_codon:yes stop_codon:yes gene_type:complete
MSIQNKDIAYNKYNYKDHRAISAEMQDYLLDVADVSNIYELDIEEINDYLNEMEHHYDEQGARQFENLVHRSA